MGCKEVNEFPKLHSKIDEKIVQISAQSHDKHLYVIDGKGQLFEILRRDEDGRVVVVDRMQTKLRDQSTLKKVVNVW